MSPSIAALGCTVFILYLFWADLRKKDASPALWIPLTWMFLAGSRYTSLWMSIGAPQVETSMSSLSLEGSALDRNIFMLLLAAGLIVLHRRGVKWSELLTNNRWVWFFFFFGLLSCLWSDYPFVSFKRLIKGAGNVIMILVVLTEPRPYEAAGVLLRRFAFLVVPLSVLFVKYYPEIGRTYNPWTDEPMFTGVSMQKNGLGQLCLISGTYFLWNLLYGKHPTLQLGWRPGAVLSVAFLGMIAWLLSMADSATSIVCLAVVSGLLVLARIPVIARAPSRLVGYGVTAACAFGVLEAVFDVSGLLISALGRDPSLTTRVPMWHALLDMVSNPLAGAGYESFWLDSRIPGAIWPAFGFLHQAHNGYLELYLNLGLIGLTLTVGGLISGLFKIRRHLGEDLPRALLRLSFILTVIIYNWTEATFAAISNVWVMFFFSVVDLSGQTQEQEQRAVAPARTDDGSAVAVRAAYSPAWSPAHARAAAAGATLSRYPRPVAYQPKYLKEPNTKGLV